MILNKITISNEKKRNTKIKIRFKTLNLRVLTRRTLQEDVTAQQHFTC